MSPFTPSGNCGSSCDNGCILCADGSYIGFYDASCFPPSLQASFGVVVTASGQAQVYNLQPEFASCSSVTPILGQCGTTQARVGRATICKTFREPSHSRAFAHLQGWSTAVGVVSSAL